MSSESANPVDDQGPEPEGNERLESWKEIASYLRCEVRTVQRWEKSEGLPVRRHLHVKLGTVYAYRSELNAWWKNRRPRSEQSRSRHASEKIMLAVLPFDNLSGDPRQEYFSDGLTEEMITQLARMQPDQLGVIARTTSIAYRDTPKTAAQIGQELGVRYILEGSVRRSGNHVRITAQLIQVSDQTHLWADGYEGDLEDILGLQSRVAHAVAGQIQIKLARKTQAQLTMKVQLNPLGYENYLKGRFFWNKRTPNDLSQSIPYFQRAIQNDPHYAPAHAALSDAYALLGTVPYDVLPPAEAMPKARQAALRALEIDDGLAEAHVALGYVRLHYDWNFSEAKGDFERALALDPSYATGHHWYANYLRVMGQLQEAILEMKQALRLDPLSLGINAAMAESYNFAREYDHVVEQARKTLELHPHFSLALFWLGRAYEEKGMVRESIETFEGAIATMGDDTLMIVALGRAYAVAGRKLDAQKILEKLIRLSKERYVPAPYMVGICAALDQKNQAFQWLETACDERCNYLAYIQREPALDGLRADPRYRDLIQRIGLPP